MDKIPDWAEASAHFQVLCLHADAGFREDLRTSFFAYGIKVVGATNCSEAEVIYAANCESIRLIVVDQSVKSCAGTSFARSVRNASYTGAIILLSSGATWLEILDYSDLGISGFFQLTVDPNLIVAMVAT